MWAAQSDEALQAQGRASARGAAGFAEFGLPMLAGLRETFANLALQPWPHAGEPLAEGQVRVRMRVAGLNFRDVLLSLGVIPASVPPANTTSARPSTRHPRQGRVTGR